MEMEGKKKQTANTYIHRQQDGTVQVTGRDPASSHGTVSRLLAYRKGGKALCLGK